MDPLDPSSADTPRSRRHSTSAERRRKLEALRRRHGELYELLRREKGLTLDRLLTLVIADEAGNLKDAAGGDETRATQFSHQLDALRKCLGSDLIRSAPGTMTMTARGAELARSAREFFRMLEHFAREGRDQQRTYRLAAGESLLHWVVIPALPGVQRRLGGLKATFRLSNFQNDQIVRGLRDRTLDFGLLRAESLQGPLQGAPVGLVRYVLATPERLLGGIRKDDWRSAIKQLPLAVLLESTYVQGEFEAGLAAAGLEPRVCLRCDTFPSAMVALRTGAFATLMIQFPGVSELPERVVPMELPFMAHASRTVVLAWDPRMLAQRSEAGLVRDALVEKLRWRQRAAAS